MSPTSASINEAAPLKP